jgi:hypothetical protein
VTGKHIFYIHNNVSLTVGESSDITL